MSLNPVDHPIVFSIPRRLTPISAWHGHIPFAMCLVDLLKPGTLVELGTHYGDSYCAFCQAVLELNLSTRCYAIDTWEGEPHSGLYGPEVLASLREHHDSLYGSFSSLVKTTFDDALAYFSAGAIDLLHIDGYHAYEVVKHDFDSWLPKMSVRGVVLFHDINVRERDFGVWKLWEELQQQYPHFEFFHAYGLGLLAVGKDFPTAFQEFLEASLEDGANVRRFFSQLGQRLTLEVQLGKYHQGLVEREHQLTQLAAERGQLAQEAAELRATVQGQQQALGEKEQQLTQLAAERGQLAQETAELRATVQGQQQALGEKEQQLTQLAAERGQLAQEAAQLQGTAQRQEQALSEKGHQLVHLAAERDRLTQEATQLQLTMQSQQQVLAQRETEVDRLAQTASQLQVAIQSQQQVLGEKEHQVAQLRGEREGLTQEVAHLQSAVRSRRETLTQLQSTLRSQQETLAQKEKEVTQLVATRERHGRESSQLRTAVQTREQYIWAIEDSLAWILVVKYRRRRDKLFPDGTRRRKIYNSVKDSFKSVARERVPAPQPNNTDSFWSLKNGQSISLRDETQQSVPQTSTTRSIFARPEQPILAKLSVVIPTKNGMSEGFESALREISKQVGISETEIVVVDSGSSDGTVEVARSYGAKVFSIPPEEFNHGATRNYAAEKTTGELIVFTVQDAIPATEDLFYEMAKALLVDPKLAGVSVRQVPKSDADIYACWEMWNHYRFLFGSPPPILRNPDEINKLSSQQLRRAAGLDNVCSMIRRQVWEKNRFKPTPFGEDLEFGLSCVRQGYSIGLLPQRGVIHSHTRSPFYTLSRHYVDMLVLLKLFEKDSRASWVEVVNHDQFFSSVKSVYMAINEFVLRSEKSFARNPVLMLTEFLSFLAEWQGTIHEGGNHEGEPTLEKFFGVLDEVFENDYPAVNPCALAFQGTINAILQFVADRYPLLANSEVIAIIYKAFASATGSILGEYCFWQNRREAGGTRLQMVDNLLRGGIQA
jgi:glycosyltransferase involved in cell wall biosynthesis/flagellar biosynthesis chaperone FliJ